MTDTRPPEWAVRCPWCAAAPNTRCTTPTGRRLTIPSHDARITAHATTNPERTST